MTLVGFLTAWANAPFTIALLVTVLFVVLSLTGALGFLTGAHDGDHDADADADDADGDGDHADVDHDADGDDDHDQDHDDGHDDAGRGFGALVLGGLGFGKLPISLTWQVFAVVFGLAGLMINARWIPIGPPPLSTLAYTIPLAILASFVVLAVLSRLLRPILSTKEAEATKRSALVGQIATVISSKVTSEFGEVRLKDQTGNVVRVLCKLADGARAPTEREQVVVVAFEEGTFFVAPLEDESPSSKRVVQDRVDSAAPEPDEDDAPDKRRATP